jgi:hypothetical protein
MDRTRNTMPAATIGVIEKMMPVVNREAPRRPTQMSPKIA